MIAMQVEGTPMQIEGVEKENFVQIVEVEPQIPFPSSKTLSILGVANLALLYAKLTVSFYVKWEFIFSPTILFFIIKTIESLIDITKQRKETISNKIQIQIDRLWNITKLYLSSSAMVVTYFFGKTIQRLVDQKEELYNTEEETSAGDLFIAKQDIENLSIITFLMFTVYALYSHAIKKMTEKPKLKEEGILQTGVVTNVLLSLMGNSFTFCAGGACNSFYISTFSAFFSAFGIPIANYIQYLNFLCLFLLAFSLFSLYSVHKSVKYWPFVLSLIGSMSVLYGMFFHGEKVFLYAGNVMIIGAAFWNSKLNKVRFGKKR